MMKRKLLIAGGLFVAAIATSYQIAQTTTAIGVGGLGVSWTDQVKPNMNVPYTLSGNANTTYGCFNKGGKNPASQNKRAVWSQMVKINKMIQADANGHVTGRMQLPIPEVGSHLKCPSGQAAKLSAVTFSNVVLTNNRAATSHRFDGSFSKVFLALK
jgi:hypothetical protein